MCGEVSDPAFGLVYVKRLGATAQQRDTCRVIASILKALEALSYSLKLKNPKMKRNVKFDDDAFDLIMEFNTDPDGNGKWRRVTPAKAKAKKDLLVSSGRATDVTDDDLDSMLS